MAGIMSAFLCLAYFLLLLVLSALHHVDGQSGTTPGIQTIFTDRCNAFQNQNPATFKNNPKNCTLLWDLFLNSFARKSSCAVDVSSYNDFLLEANHTVAITDQAMFWAYVNPFVYNFTASQSGRYVTILDLLSGYILNNLNWCWNLTNDALDYYSCPYYNTCPFENEAVRSFWKANSQMFAGLATGKVFAMLNGSTSIGAYSNLSLFYTVEVQAIMRNPSVSRMQAILVHNPGGPVSENCYNGTLIALKNDLSSKSIAFDCIEDPPEVIQLQCQIYPQYAKYCQESSTPSGAMSSTAEYQAIAIIVFIWVVKLI